MLERDFDRIFPHQSEPAESLEDLFRVMGEMSFYAPVLVNTFRGEVDPNTVATIGKKHRIPHYFSVGAKLKGWDFGYLRLIGGTAHTPLKLKLSSWKNWSDVSMEKFRDSLLETGNYWTGHEDILTVSSDEEALTGMSVPIKGHERIQVQSELRISFATGRFKIAPTNPGESLLWWALTDFVPRFLHEYTAPTANVPTNEMKMWKNTSSA